MIVAKDTVVQLHYMLKDADGKQIESTAGHDPIVYLQGHNNMIPGFEQLLRANRPEINLKSPSHLRTAMAIASKARFSVCR